MPLINSVVGGNVQLFADMIKKLLQLSNDLSPLPTRTQQANVVYNRLKCFTSCRASEFTNLHRAERHPKLV